MQAGILDSEKPLREVMVKTGQERVDIQEGAMVEALLDSREIGVVMSSEFVRKQEFKLKNIEIFIYVRNIDGKFNKEEPIKNTEDKYIS